MGLKKAMKLLLSITCLILLLSCNRETRITPDKLTSIEYGTYFGFAGWITKVTVYPQKQVLQPDYRSAKTCEVSISTTEWNELTQLFDENAFKKVKVGEESVCPDASAAWIIAGSPSGEVKALWGPCTGGDPTGIESLINALDKRLKQQQATCK
jgi:hypothetical protein